MVCPPQERKEAPPTPDLGERGRRPPALSGGALTPPPPRAGRLHR